VKLRNKSQRKSLHVPLFAATLASTTIFPIITQQFNAAQAAPVPAKSADSFVDSIGVNTHFTYGGTPYERFDEMKSKLQEVGIRHIRDGGYNDPDFFNKLRELGSVGIKSNIIFSRNPTGEVLDVVKSLSGAIEAVEGPNESDLEFFNFSYNGQKFPEGTRNYQQDLYHAIKNDSATKVIIRFYIWLGKKNILFVNKLIPLEAKAHDCCSSSTRYRLAVGNIDPLVFCVFGVQGNVKQSSLSYIKHFGHTF